MNFLILTNKMPYPPNDGGCIGTLVMINGLKKLGHNVTVFAMNTHKHNFNIENLPQELKENIEWYSCYVDTSINPPEMLYNLLFSNIPYNAKRFISKTYKSKLIDILKKKTFDIVHLEGLYLYPYISSIRKNSEALIAFRAHNVEQEIWKRTVRNQSPSIKRVYNRILSLRMQRFEKKSLKNVDLLVPLTERDGYILDFLGNRSPVHVAPIGIDIEELKVSNTQPPHNTVYYIGALDWTPNQEGLLWFVEKVWGLVLKEYPEAQFHIAGRNAPASLKHKLNRKNIIFHGSVENAHDFVQQYNIMITPLLTGSGMRVKLIEAMAFRKPIVSTYIGAEGIVNVNETYMYLAHNETEFANYVIDLLKNPNKCKLLGENARNYIEKNFDNSTIINGLVEFYKQQIRKQKNND